MRRRVRAGACSLAAVLGLGLVMAAGASAAPSFSARGSAKQVYVTGLAPNASMSLIAPGGKALATQQADSLGGLLFRNVPPGSGYRVRLASNGSQSGPITVHSDAAKPWDPDVYNQSIPDNGYTYLTTRDGTQLAIDVHPPTSPAGEPGLPLGLPVPPGLPSGSGLPLPLPSPPGLPQPLAKHSHSSVPFVPPYPTLIEYSGYGYADPNGPVNGIAVLANLMGFAVVDVNMRGTGCSGGAYDFFEPLQSLDAYDVIETIAHQPWVLGHKVGMMGISYGAISQLFAAQLDPPDLAAISPLSTIDATATTLYPGGILNTGFAVAWAQQRQQEAEPAGPNSGQPYAYQQIQNGDQTCKANQTLHGEAAEPDGQDPRELSLQRAGRRPARPGHVRAQDQGAHVHGLPVGGRTDRRALPRPGRALHRHQPQVVHVHQRRPRRLARPVHVRPLVRLPGAVRRPPGADRKPGGDPGRRPGHLPAGDGSPADRPRHAAGRSDPDEPDLPIGAPGLRGAAGGTGAVRQRRRPVAHGPIDGGRSVPGVRAVLLDVPDSGHQGPRSGTSGRGGALRNAPPRRRGINRYTSNAKATPLTDFGTNTGTGGLWGNASQWQWNWQQNPSGTAVSYVSAPLTANTTVIGSGAVHLWVRSSTPDVDLQATISEVRPDGNETFVQNGWIRASERKLSTSRNNMFKQRSTLLEPIPSVLAADVTPMPEGQFVKVVIPLYYEGHAYRAGSRIRVTIAAPNGTQPIWSFGETEPSGTSSVSIAFSKTMPSSLVLPVVPGVNVPTGYPACPSLRNEPCRPYVALADRTARG